ncbi:MAG: hypothetical protein JWO64_2144 [Hyphomicrobiales bacterium]|nr:hypothetical protein [Hyphomicrobiales bacterium]
MLTAGLSGIRAYGPGVLDFAVITLLAGLLIDRRILTDRPAQHASALASVPLVSGDDPLPGLRRIVLDPCTGLEKPQTRGRTAKAD